MQWNPLPTGGDDIVVASDKMLFIELEQDTDYILHLLLIRLSGGMSDKMFLTERKNGKGHN